jgi:hypothetical protein
MGLFDFFSKKDDKAPLRGNVTVKNLQVGDFIDYYMKSWQVKELYEYDWGNNFYAIEYKLDSGDEIRYLYVEEDDELILSVSEKINIMSISKDIKEYIVEHDAPMKRLEYKGITYYLSKESLGHCRDWEDDGDDEENWSELVSWEFLDETEKKFISIERWGEYEIESAIGVTIEEYEITNIIPVSN